MQVYIVTEHEHYNGEEILKVCNSLQVARDYIKSFYPKYNGIDRNYTIDGDFITLHIKIYKVAEDSSEFFQE